MASKAQTTIAIRVAAKWLGSNAVAVDHDLVCVIKKHDTVLSMSTALQKLIATAMPAAFDSHDVVRVVWQDGNVELTPNPKNGAHCTDSAFVAQPSWTPSKATARAWKQICDAEPKAEDTSESKVQRQHKKLRRVAVIISRYSDNDVLAGRFYCCREASFNGLWYNKYRSSDSARNSASVVHAVLVRSLGKPHYVHLTFLNCSQRLRDNEALALSAVLKDPHNLALTSQRLRSDKKFVRQVVKRDGNAIMYASQELKDDKDVVLDAVTNNGMALRFASQRMRSDHEIALASVAQNALALAFVWGPTQNDPDLVKVALINCQEESSSSFWAQITTPYAFVANESVSKHTLQLAVASSSSSLLYMSDAQRNDADIVSCAFKHGYRDAVWCISDALRNDSAFVRRALETSDYAPDVLSIMSDAIRSDKQVVIAVVECHGRELKFAADALRDDKDVVLAAVAQDEQALHWASERIRNNPGVLHTHDQKKFK